MIDLKSIYGLLIHVYVVIVGLHLRRWWETIRALVDLAHFSRLIGVNPRESFPSSCSFFFLFRLFFHGLTTSKLDTPVEFSGRIHKHCEESLTPQVEDETGRASNIDGQLLSSWRNSIPTGREKL